LLIAPTSPIEKPGPRIRKAVVRLPANASPILYKIIRARNAHAAGRLKNSVRGPDIASFKDSGGRTVSSGSGPKTVAIVPINIRPAINK